MEVPFQLPDESLITALCKSFPCREQQIRALSTLLWPSASPCKNIVVYGSLATGKSAITGALVKKFCEHHDTDRTVRSATIDSIQCVTGRHLLERIVGAVAAAQNQSDRPRKCENLAQLAVELTKLLEHRDRNEHFILVLDGIDRQREAPPTLIPALGRLSDIIPRVTCVFIVTSPRAAFLRTSSVVHVHFPNYTKPEFVKILSLRPPPIIPTTTEEETAELWTKFCGAVHDSLTKSASRTLPAFRHSCHALWPRFTAPIQAGTYGPREFSKLLIASRAHFQDESLLNPSIVSVAPKTSNKAATPRLRPLGSDLATILPTIARLLLLAAYLASHNAARHDLTVFSTFHHGKRKKRGGFTAPRSRQGGKHRKIARKLLGAHSFVMERMMAIFTALRTEWAAGRDSGIGASGLDGDVGVAISTLASLRLLVRVGLGADPMDRGARWRINVGWDAVRAVGRSIGVEIEDWLVE